MSKQFYQVGGSLPANSKSYIKREADDKLYSYLKEGKYCYVLNARQTGKSSLRVHTSKRLEESGYSCVNIDLTSIGSEDITADEWYFSFLSYIIEKLGLDEDEFAEWWDNNDKLTVVNRFAKTFDKFVLEVSVREIIIFVDEVDYILGIKKDFSTDDFFAVIRTFYNLRSEDERYNRVTFALFGVATPEDLMQDSTRTPFNIAHSIKIIPFKLEESLSLVEGLDHQSVNRNKILEKIFEWTGGTPYLTQKILYYISSNPIEDITDINKIVDTIFIQKSFNEINISDIQKRIVNSELYSVKMLYLIGELICEGQITADDRKMEQIYLKLSGLVKEENALLIYTNKIYKQIFNQKWLDETIGKIDRPLSQDLQRWLKLDRSSSALLKGKVLKEVNSWAFGRDDLTSEESEYLRLSMIDEQKDILEKEKKKAQSKQIKYLTAFSFLLVLFAFGLGYLYLETEEQKKIAQIERNKAIEQEKLVNEQKKIAEEQKKIVEEHKIALEKQKIKFEKQEALFESTLFSETLQDSEKASIQTIERYTPLSKENPTKYKPIVGKALQDLAFLYNVQNQFDKAIDYYTKSLDIYNEVNSTQYLKNKAKIFTSLADIYMEKNKYSIAENFYNKSLIAYKELKEKELEARTLSSIGELLKKIKKNRESILYFKKSLKIYKQLSKEKGNRYIDEVSKLRREVKLNELDKKKEKKKIFIKKGWIYLGEYYGKKWIKKYFKFDSSISPKKLINTYQISKGKLYVRTEAYFGDIVDVIKIGEKVKIIKIEDIGVYKWAYVKY